MRKTLIFASFLLSTTSALPQTQHEPSPVLSARQAVVTNADGVTTTVQQNSGSSKAVTIGATAAIIVGFVALILIGIWIGSWRRKKNVEWREAQQEAKNQHRLTMGGRGPGSVQMTPTSSISSSAKMHRKSSALSLTPSTTSSFASSGIPAHATPQHEQRRPPVLHQPSPRTPSALVQSSILHQHSEYPPPPPSNDRPDARSLPPASPEVTVTRASFYAAQPSRPSPLSSSVTLPPSEPAPPLSQSPPSFEPPTRHAPEAPTTPTPARRQPSFQPPARRKSSANMNLIITVPSSNHEALHAPPGLENVSGNASPNSIWSGEMGKAM